MAIFLGILKDRECKCAIKKLINFERADKRRTPDTLRSIGNVQLLRLDKYKICNSARQRAAKRDSDSYSYIIVVDYKLILSYPLIYYFNIS